MSTDVEIDRALAAVTSTLNDQKLESFDSSRVQQIVTESPGGEQALSVDHGGGLHDRTGARVGSIRRAPSGEWLADRENETAERSSTAIPVPGPHSRLRTLLTKLKLASN